jgi:hypothetical protein
MPTPEIELHIVTVRIATHWPLERIKGKRLQERLAIVPICWATHSGPELDKEKNEYIALCRATLPDLMKYPRVAWWQRFVYLHGKFANVTS